MSIALHGLTAPKKDAAVSSLISVLMPLYNPNVALLKEAVKSVEHGGYSQYEIVVYDRDQSLGAPDGLRYLPEYEEIQFDNVKARFRYFTGPDNSPISGVNNCISRAKSYIFHFFCADDLMYPGALRLVNNVFQGRKEEPFWIYGRTVLIDEKGARLSVSGGPFTYEDMLIHNRIGTNAVFWNRKMMDVAGVFDEKYRFAADYDLWLRMWKVRPPVFVDYEFRRHPEQTSTRETASVVNEAFTVSDKHLAAYRQAGFLMPPEWEL